MLIKEKDFQGFVRGREKSFETIFHQYYTTLVSFAMRFGLEEMEAEDIVIEILHRIWERREKMKSSAALHVLLYTSVRNRVFTSLRNLHNRNRILGEHGDKEEDEEAEKAFYDRLRQEEMVQIWDRVLQELTPQCRQVVLGLLDGKSVAEIAKEMAVTVNSVKTYKLRAIEVLRHALKNYPLLLWSILIQLEY